MPVIYDLSSYPVKKVELTEVDNLYACIDMENTNDTSMEELRNRLSELYVSFIKTTNDFGGESTRKRKDIFTSMLKIILPTRYSEFKRILKHTLFYKVLSETTKFEAYDGCVLVDNRDINILDSNILEQLKIRKEDYSAVVSLEELKTIKSEHKILDLSVYRRVSDYNEAQYRVFIDVSTVKKIEVDEFMTMEELVEIINGRFEKGLRIRKHQSDVDVGIANILFDEPTTIQINNIYKKDQNMSCIEKLANAIENNYNVFYLFIDVTN